MYSKFLKRVLAKEGYYCIIGLDKKGRAKQVFRKTLEEVDQVVQKFVDSNYNVYFGCAKFVDPTRRDIPNAGYFKSLWLDIDCGPDKDQKKAYPDQETALTELIRFCEETRLPIPTLVNSGLGIHAYWRFKTELTKEEWLPMGKRLKELCRKHNFRVDPAVPADAARVMRIPGTFNQRGNPPIQVEVLASSVLLEVDEIREILGASAELPSVPDYIKREISPLQQRLMQNKSNSFEKILTKSAEGKGCAQIVYIAQNQADCDYNLWRAGLSIARNCTDWKVAIHAISSEHPNYDFEFTEKKAEDLVDKPYLCSTMDDMNPNGCEGCPLKGKIKSPIVLGSEVERSESDTIEYKESVEEPIFEDSEDNTSLTITYKIPNYPYPYFRGKNGGVYRRTEDDDDKLIYENDLYIVKRMDDKGRGELALARVHLPKDRPKEFIIPLTAMGSKEELRKVIASQGIICMPAFVDGIMGYLIESVKMQQLNQDAEILRQQMGWVAGENKFVIGTKEYSEYGARYSPPSETTESVAVWMKRQGSLDEWKRVADVYAKPGFEPHAFAFFSSFGSVLMPFTGYKGAFINLINKESGTGKTTILHMINSVWGHPQELLSKESDTVAHKLFRLGVLQNLPFTADELSNMKGDAVSQLLYSVSQGKGAGRMMAQANMERKNDTTWSTIGVGSSNSSMVELLANFKAGANGEIMRLLEYPIRKTNLLNKQDAHELFEGTLFSNYGHAGPLYIQYILKNRDEVMQLISELQNHIDEKANFSNQNRYWSAVIACNIAGALIAREVGLISIDPMKVLDWVIATLVPTLMGVVGEQAASYDDILGQYINENLMSALIINGSPDSRTNLPQSPIQLPKMQLLMRAEPDTKKIWVSAKSFKEFCVKHRIIHKEMMDLLKEKGVLLGEKKKRLGKGTHLVGAPAITTYEFMYSDFDDIIQGLPNENPHD